LKNFEETGSALDKLRAVVGRKQKVRSDETVERVKEAVQRSPRDWRSYNLTIRILQKAVASFGDCLYCVCFIYVLYLEHKSTQN
jgi:hypothetical protein